MEKIIKHRLFTWFEEGDSPVMPGTTVLTERIAHHGEKIDITNPAYIKRGEELDAFYTDDEAAAIEDGSYRGADAEILYRRRSGQRPAPTIEPAEGEGFQISGMTAEELGEYIKEQRLTVDQTVALAEDGNLESIEKVLDAENIASDNTPRKGVEDRLEAKLQALTQQ